jgi:hypothetical protein
LNGWSEGTVSFEGSRKKYVVEFGEFLKLIGLNEQEHAEENIPFAVVNSINKTNTI